MSKVVKISTLIKEGLEYFGKEHVPKKPELRSGFLYGHSVQKENTELVYALAASNSIEFEPDGLAIVGFYYINDSQEPIENETLLTQIGSQISPKHGRVPVLSLANDGTIKLESYAKKTKKISEELPGITIQWFDPELEPMDIEFISIRLTASSVANVMYQKSSTDFDLNSWKNDIKTQLYKKGFSYHLKDGVADHEFASKGIKPKPDKDVQELGDLYNFMEPDEDLSGIPKNLRPKMLADARKRLRNERRPFHFSVINIQSAGDEALKECPEFYKCGDASDGEKFVVPLNVDTVFQVPYRTKYLDLMSRLDRLLTNRIEKTAQLIQKWLSCDNSILHLPQDYLFKIPGCILNVTYPRAMNDKELLSTRKRNHEMHLLPLTRPYLRKTQSVKPESLIDPLSENYLENVHLGLVSAKGTQYVVRGRYLYHHYLQDKMQDSGWGCAYRSLQTIASWFRLNGYTDKPTPTHKEIQQALVDVGDKEKNFVGSSLWIGSQEVSIVLNQLLGVTSKIIFVSSGAEMGSKARELVQHFKTQGTPIMIGGGVLAHTILGVDFNELTGTVKFLILDPHYTGGEDLSVIQNKGWCGWKPVTFWDSKSFYNLCLPQVPIEY